MSEQKQEQGQQAAPVINVPFPKQIIGAVLVTIDKQISELTLARDTIIKAIMANKAKEDADAAVKLAAGTAGILVGFPGAGGVAGNVGGDTPAGNDAA